MNKNMIKLFSDTLSRGLLHPDAQPHSPLYSFFCQNKILLHNFSYRIKKLQLGTNGHTRPNLRKAFQKNALSNL